MNKIALRSDQARLQTALRSLTILRRPHMVSVPRAPLGINWTYRGQPACAISSVKQGGNRLGSAGRRLRGTGT
jgi:hypothetical protein